MEHWSVAAITWRFSGNGVVSIAMPPPCRAFESASAGITDNVALSVPAPTMGRIDCVMHAFAGEGGSENGVLLSGAGGTLFEFTGNNEFGEAYHLTQYFIVPAGMLQLMLQSYGDAANPPWWAADAMSFDFSGVLQALDMPTVTPGRVAVAGPGSVRFSLLPAELPPVGNSLSYKWQFRPSAGDWLNIRPYPYRAVLPGGGSATADTPNQNRASITIAPTRGVTAYQIRCIISDSHGSLTTDPADYTICYANCDASTTPPILNVNDFLCFMTRFAAGDTLANCDGNTVPPFLDVNDFVCFQAQFAAGCP